MRISHSNKFVFIAIPRTGSTSLRAALDSVSDIKSVYKYQITKDFPFYNHISASELRAEFDKNNWDWNEYKKFAVARNPFDRCVSLYHHRLETGSRYAVGKSKTYNYLRKLKYELGPKKSFKQWLFSSQTKIDMCASVSAFCHDENGEMLVDRILRFEHIYEDFASFASEIGIEERAGQLKRTNSSKARSDYRSYYDAEAIAFVEKKYHYELEHFGYEF